MALAGLKNGEDATCLRHRLSRAAALSDRIMPPGVPGGGKADCFSTFV